jgi:NADH-quinone oxidoreductase subunit N
VVFDRAVCAPWVVSAISLAALPFSALAFGWHFIAEPFRPFVAEWQALFGALGVASLWAGSLGMLVRKNLQEFLAYAALSQSGWLLLALSSQSPMHLENASAFFLLSQGVAVLVFAFGVSAIEGAHGGKSPDAFFAGLLRTHPGLGFLLAMAFSTLAGLPWSAGFAFRTALIGKLATGSILSLTLLALLSTIPHFYTGAVLVSKLASPPGKEPLAIPLSRAGFRFFWAISVLLLLGAFLPTSAWPG